MKFFKLDNINVDPRYCRVDPIIASFTDLTMGRSAKPIMERLEEDTLDLAMNEDRGGLELPDYVSTTASILALSTACATAIAEGFELGEHELLPARLINKKKRVHSDEYLVLNPLGQIECLNVERSDMNGDKDNPLVQIMGKWCLHTQEVPPDRDLFRVKSVIGYIFSERLVEHIQSEGYTNFHFTPVPLC